MTTKPRSLEQNLRFIRVHEWINTGGLVLGLACLAKALGAAETVMGWFP